MRTINLIIAFFTAIILLTSCDKDENNVQNPTKRQFGIFKVLEDNKTVEMDGDIRTKTLKDFNELQETYPKIKTINIKNCGGSLDDTANLKMSLKVHQSGINMHLMDNAKIASGGVDFFLAGVKRTRGKNTKIGVHAWGGDGDSATDYPKGHANHLPYIKYYVS
ncbi:MAG: hypothetical protein CSA15_12785, partial [Candidatus Delongbacteria bacterium]